MKRIAHSEQGQINRIVKRYEELYQKNPRSKIFAPLSDTYRQKGDLDRALSLCLDGVKNHPNYSSGRLALGKCYFDKRMYRNAISELTKVIEVNPRNVMAQTYLGKSFLAVQEYENALKAFYSAKEIAPQNSAIEKIISRLEVRTRPPILPIEQNSTQEDLKALSRKSLFLIEPDQFVIRPAKEVFAKIKKLPKEGQLSRKNVFDQTHLSLQKLFLTQGLTKKADNVDKSKGLTEFTPPEIHEKFVSPDKDSVRNNIIKEPQIFLKPPNINHIIEESMPLLPSSIRKKIASEEEVFPETNIIDFVPKSFYKREEKTKEVFTKEDFAQVKKIHIQEKAATPQANFKTIINKAQVKKDAINKLNVYLTRIAERAY